MNKIKEFSCGILVKSNPERWGVHNFLSPNGKIAIPNGLQIYL